MTFPRPSIHDPNPTAVPIKEAIKETFRVFIGPSSMVGYDKNPGFVPSGRLSTVGSTYSFMSRKRLASLLCRLLELQIFLSQSGLFTGDRFQIRKFHEQLFNFALLMRLRQAGLGHDAILSRREAVEKHFGCTTWKASSVGNIETFY
jgi:hypothetical protein